MFKVGVFNHGNFQSHSIIFIYVVLLSRFYEEMEKKILINAACLNDTIDFACNNAEFRVSLFQCFNKSMRENPLQLKLMFSEKNHCARKNRADNT